MRKLFFVFALVTGSAFADDSVNGYYRQDGTYVQPYQRTAPDNTTSNNYNQPQIQQYPSYVPPVVPQIFTAQPVQPAYGGPLGMPDSTGRMQGR